MIQYQQTCFIKDPDSAMSGGRNCKGAEHRHVTSNAWTERPKSLKAIKAGYYRTRGPACFDFAAYVAGSPDLATLAKAGPHAEAELWAHFVHTGQFERRPFR